MFCFIVVLPKELREIGKECICKQISYAEFSWSIFYDIWTKCKVLWSKCPYSLRMREIMGQEKLRMWNVFKWWNEYIISRSINRGASGRPGNTYLVPYFYNCQGYAGLLEDHDINKFLAAVEEIPPNFSPEFGEYTENIM